MIVSIIHIVVCVIIVALVLMQDSPKGTSGALTGSADSDTHYDKIKGRTGSVILKKATVVAGVVFLIMTFVINL